MMSTHEGPPLCLGRPPQAMRILPFPAFLSKETILRNRLHRMTTTESSEDVRT
ncbi:hypothetical protein KC19_10G004000 [Ceratodon purpureus]|uniref:Uncharacterized protein n=1 Tax=Ceratodon purpureus TaxID=3225 RepID=A0A8T0GIV1_CERPU|nr:hypothetical protein KC19_10G004000 [Ceratodon purpureus]